MRAVFLLAAWMLSVSLQSVTADRARAEELARAGQTVEAMTLFEKMVTADPADTEARLWIARLELRLGRVSEAEAGFQGVLRDHPGDIDATIGLGSVLLRRGAWADALVLLTETAPRVGDNADFYGVLARAYRRAGDDARALELFDRARRLSPRDPDLASSYEDVVRAYGHTVIADGFAQGGGTGADTGSGSLAASIRIAPRWHLDGSVRVQQGPGYTDSTGGGGVLWRLGRDTVAAVHGVGGSGNTSLARRALWANVTQYAGAFEIGGDVRRLSFVTADVTALSPVLAWHPNDTWRVDARYTYSRATFAESGQSSGDDSIMTRATWQPWRRVALIGTYAHGIESFETLTTDRLDALGSTTTAGGVRVDARTLTRLTATWEHQRRSNQTLSNRFIVSLAQAIR